ncbi:MAG: hypothetical protein V3U03_04540 [Myxococcota bacterium]
MFRITLAAACFAVLACGQDGSRTGDLPSVSAGSEEIEETVVIEEEVEEEGAEEAPGS